MARSPRPSSFYGTCNGICVYRMYGNDYIRTASSLTGERVKKDPAFKNTMAWAGRLAAASKLASAVYAMLPNYRRKFRLYRKLTGKSMQLLKAGKAVGETVVELLLFVRLPKKKAKKITGERTRVRITGTSRTGFEYQQKRSSTVIVMPATTIHYSLCITRKAILAMPSLRPPQPAIA